MSENSRQDLPTELEANGTRPEETSRSLSNAVLLEPPDGGLRAWLVVLGSTLALFCTVGVSNAYGFFQSYYTSNLLSASSSSTISLIGALQLAIAYGGGPITGRLFDAYGLDILLPVGSFLQTLSFMLISICQKNQPYQFFLVQGVMSGIGNAMVFTPAVAVAGHWFKRRRAYAIGIIIAGSSLGGVIYPIMLQHLQTKVGFAWSVRIAGFLTLACLVVAWLTMRTRLALKGSVTISEVIDLGGFRDLRYTLTTIASFLFFYALFIPYFYIQEYANFRGVSANISLYLLAIMNAAGVIARVIPGLMGDYFGVLEILLPSTVLSGAMVLALWLPARGSVPIILFSALYGLFSGCFVSLLPAYVATITPVERFGARLGVIFFFIAVACLVGTPTAGAFVPTFTESNFRRLIIFTGVLILVSAALIGLAHYVRPRTSKGSDSDAASETKTAPTPTTVEEEKNENGVVNEQGDFASRNENRDMKQ